MIGVSNIEIDMQNITALSLMALEIYAIIQTDRHDCIDYIYSVIDADKENKYFLGSEIIPSPFYIHNSHVYNIPLVSLKQNTYQISLIINIELISVSRELLFYTKCRIENDLSTDAWVAGVIRKPCKTSAKSGDFNARFFRLCLIVSIHW